MGPHHQTLRRTHRLIRMSTPAHPHLEVKDIEAFRPMHWLALAWKDMERCPTAGVTHGLILALVAGGLFWFARHDFWWIAAMLSVSMIIAPLLATGLYDISRRLERGEEATLTDAQIDAAMQAVLAQLARDVGARLRA